MLIIPAIDIKDGNCVRLLQGDPERETVYSKSPVDMAKKFESLGARLIHVVDLDGAFQGIPVNREIVTAIAQSVAIPIEIGGGIRTVETIRQYNGSGIHRLIMGTVILEDEFRNIIEEFRDILVAGIDARDSMVATHGWKNISTMKAMDLISEIWNMGIPEIIYTDISTDGMLTGPNFSAIEGILKEFPGIRLIASGGVSSIEDLDRLYEYSDAGLIGCIVGKAIYDGRIDLGEALEQFGQREKNGSIK